MWQVREIQFSYNNEGFRWQSAALEALQHAAEDFLVQLLEEAYVLNILWIIYSSIVSLFCFVPCTRTLRKRT